MVNVDLELLRRDFPVSHALLAHDGLMTRQLIRLFGPVHAIQTRIEIGNDIVRRWSTIRQTASDTTLLQATLVIARANLPEGLLDRLQSGNRLFGGSLIEAGVAVRLIDRVIFRAPARDQHATPAWGRRHRILRANDNALLCDVEESLSEEAVLRPLLQAPLPKTDPAA